MSCEKVLALFLLCLLTFLSVVESKPRRSLEKKPKVQVVRGDEMSSCDPDRLTVFRVTLVTHWSRDKFPKQYPEWRPPAQWSKLIGRTHNSSYILFRVGGLPASEGLKEFTETGRTDVLDSQSQGEGGVYDEFNAPPILTGEGKTEAEFFVDGLHPKVDPLDAGTDSGFTFTAPNWPTVPAEKVTRITAKEPNHPANSFHYPDLDELPPIATFYLQKVKEYELSNTYPSKTSMKGYLRDKSSKKLNFMDKSRSEDILPPIYAAEPEFDGNNETILKPIKLKSKKTKIPAGDRKSLLKSITDHYKKQRKVSKKKLHLSGKRHRKREQMLPVPQPLLGHKMKNERNCIVGEWSEWSPCSKECGIGESLRTRPVIRAPKRGGNPCPELEEKKWCGSSRDCSHTYFDW
ncbi:hypothetical protein QYM36_007287 [Artemia franciscana]|uniref:Spondin domain-containing protein n=1 Tax=Artemia franciscana TaxID=6661 RepID=A0AA88I8B0_ARTSF|nr:hypothetical protein QYM36_007287 [Artemia franciscana]